MADDVLLIGFNRPALIESQLERLAGASWKRLFINIDGPRPGRDDDKISISGIEKIIESWRDRLPGDLVVRMRKRNLGGCDGPADAISWALESADELIILEDDCAPAADFLPFATAMLERYRNEPRIMSIGGFNPLPEPLRRRIRGDYCVTRKAQVWGWATWRNRWERFADVRNSDDLDELVLKAFTDRKEQVRWRDVLNGKYPRALGWSSYWSVACRLNQGLHILPAANLIKNTGMGVGATRTAYIDPTYLIDTDTLKPPYREPESLTPIHEIERWFWKTAMSMSFTDRLHRFYRTRIKGRFYR